jgi:hypothetical protein
VLVISNGRSTVAETLAGPPERDWEIVAELAALPITPDATWWVEQDTTPRAAADGMHTAPPGPRCERPECGLPIHYQRGAHMHGGGSEWVHTETLAATCPDGGGVCGRPANWDARRAS